MSQFSELYHYGTKRHSGRYPWGSGEDPYQHEEGFLETVNKLKAQGLSEKEIADAMGMSTTELRERKSVEKAAQHAAEDAEIRRLHDEGWTNVAIAEKLGRSEGYVRNRLNPVVKERSEILNNTADVLRDRLTEVSYLDIGAGSEALLGVSSIKLNAAVQKLKDEGYEVYYVKVPQVGIPGQYTYMKVLAPPGTEYTDVSNNRDQIALAMNYYTNDGGRSYLGIKPPTSVDSDRIMVRYAEDGGVDKDGVIELRRGVDDLSLENANYAQVRIAVDGTRYLKGMAMYSDGPFPDGVDIIFNTNKSQDIPKMDVFKKMKTTDDGEIDMDNPFGATLKMQDGIMVGQRNYIDKDGNEQLSALNIVREEGDWNTWSKTLSSQFLSKQPEVLIKKQLNLTYDNKKEEYDAIMALTNPEVKAMLLESFADSCDADAVSLKAAALPRQSSKVILPLTNISDNEIYAPSYRDGEQVALIRYPHGGTFEIPVLTVNNKNEDGKNYIGQNPIDAVGISSKVAARLSGADFDGDTVVVIPTSGQKIKSSPALKELKDFDPKQSYPGYEGMKVMSNTQMEMGKISNLITDMTIKGATEPEIARAVKHSMVVIDAEKHELNYKQSEIDNNIKALKEKYQGGANNGASTLISKASSDQRVGVRKEKTNVNNMTEEEKKLYLAGKKVYEYTGETYTKNGKEVLRTDKSTKMYETDDAYTLSSGTRQENLYADYANKMKSLANSARAVERSIEPTKYNKSAKETYQKEVDSLNSKLNTAIKNKPYERQAQLIANVYIDARVKEKPSLKDDPDQYKKLKTQALAEARNRVGASKKRTQVNITDSEWEAIQNGAISHSKLVRILENTDQDRVKQLATPRTSNELSSSQKSRIRNLAKSGYTQAEIADAVGVSVNTVNEYINTTD